jgi:hypothetical protein
MMFQNTSVLSFGAQSLRGAPAVSFSFTPNLVKGVDYEDITEYPSQIGQITLRLLPGRVWRSAPGSLSLSAIDAGAGEYRFSAMTGLPIAEILPSSEWVDLRGNLPEGVEIVPSTAEIFSDQPVLSLVGRGLSKEFDFQFDPPHIKGVDYDVEEVSSNELRLILKPARLWQGARSTSADRTIFLRRLKLPGADRRWFFPPGLSVPVARISSRILVQSPQPAQQLLHETQSKELSVLGRNFPVPGRQTVAPHLFEESELRLLFSPPIRYEKLLVRMDGEQVKLVQNGSADGLGWLDAAHSLRGQSGVASYQLLLTGILSPRVDFDPPIPVATIVPDIEGVRCDDSCRFSFDGTCDDNEEDEGVEEDKDDYYEDDNRTTALCAKGTDCTDCGGVEAILSGRRPAARATSSIGKKKSTSSKLPRRKSH